MADEKQMEVIPSESNKDVITSYDFAVLRDTIGIYGQRLMLRLVEAANATGIMEGLDFKDGTDFTHVSPAKVDSNLFGYTRIVLPKTAIMGATEEYSKVEKDIEACMREIIKYVDVDGNTIMFPFLSYVKFERGNIRIEVRKELWTAMLNFTKGFRKLELAAALRLRSKYSFKIYKIVSGQENALSYSLRDFKEILGASWTEEVERGKGRDKKKVRVEKEIYPNPSDFFRRVIVPAKAELDACSPYSFNFEPIFSRKTKTGRAAITGIRLIPLYQPKFRDPDLACEEAINKHRGAFGDFGLSREQKTMLMHKFGFTEKGIRNNHELWENCAEYLDLTKELDAIAVRISKFRPANPAGYVIKALRGILEDFGVKV